MTDELVMRPAPSFAETVHGHEDLYALVCAVCAAHPDWTSTQRVYEVLRLRSQKGQN